MITSPHNEKLKEVRKLQRRRERRFVAEGEDLLAAAADAGWPAVYELRAGVDVEADLLDGVSGLGSGTRALGVFEQRWGAVTGPLCVALWGRSEEHTSELQSRRDLVCRLLLEKKK